MTDAALALLARVYVPNHGHVDTGATQPEHAFTGTRTCDVCFVDSSVAIDVVEYLGALFTVAPTADRIAGLGFRGRRGTRWQQWTAQLEKTPRVRRLARELPAPHDPRPLPDRVPGGNAADLRHLADNCFPELAA